MRGRAATGACPTGEADALRAALDDAYGTLVTVTKRRHLLLWEGVRIHLDEVEGLGSYLELEAVAEPDSDLARGEREGRTAAKGARDRGSRTWWPRATRTSS